ncbi:MAG: efflux RND transporter permease subunit [Proteobacteria bacterium]|nr:efflux RND transporter permease subunit [Pseudomonadota bacterium]
MIISDTAVNNRVSVFILALIILVFGTSSYNSLPRENSPDISIPYVFISTSYKGVASSDIETSITIPIEKKLKGLEGVKKIHSISSEGISKINIEFVPGTNIDDALQKVKDKVDESKNDLPQDLENDPSVFEVNFSEMPIVVYSISGTCGMARLKEIADELEEDIESIPGVLQVDVTGGSEREIIIEVDPDKLTYYRIPISAFFSAVNNENQNTSGGSISLGDGRYQLRVPGEISDPNELYHVVVASFNGRPVYLKDLAVVKDGFKDEDSRSRLNGKEAINVAVKKRTGENILIISEEIDRLIENKKLSWPAGTQITKLMNDAKEIRNMVLDLENNILSGLILVVVVLFFALGLRNSVLVALAIPFSMLLSFMVLSVFGITLNMVVLFSLTLALGMLVDNAIVIVENIYRYMEQGVPKIEAAIKGTSEVAYPVIGSTLTTLAAFLPLAFWPGIMGEFMKYLPITLIITLSSSLFVALVINPALCAFFMKIKINPSEQTDASGDDINAMGEQPIEIKGKILESYSKVLKIALQFRVSVLLCSVALLVLLTLIWVFAVGLERPLEFFPEIDPRNIYVNIDPPEGADLDYIDQILKKVEIVASSALNKDDEKAYLDFITSPPLNHYNDTYDPKPFKDKNGEPFTGPTSFRNVKHIYAKVIKNFSGATFGSSADNHLGIQFLDLEDRITPSVNDMEEIRKRVQYIPGARITVEKENNGPPTGPPINIEISGDNYQNLGRLAKDVRRIIGKIPHMADLRDDYVDAIPAIQINVDKQKAAMFGLSTYTIGYVIKTAFNGLNISTYYANNDDFDITVKLPENDRKTTDVLHALMIPTPTGQLVPLTTVASITYAGSLGDIVRIDHNRVVTIKANVENNKIPGVLLRTQAEELLKNFTLPKGYGITFTGENKSQKESEDFLEKAFIIAIFLIFLILVTLFNSVNQPLIIMVSVILSLGGVFLGLTVLSLPFGVIMTGVGTISLAGVVVNNAIVLIDYTNKLKERGLSTQQAIISAGATRLRPVMLTAITTILGLLPMVTGISYDFHKMSISLVSESSQYWRSMAIVVIFGLMIATILTLVVVPTLYSLLSDFPRVMKSIYGKVHDWYWQTFDRLAGEK